MTRTLSGIVIPVLILLGSGTVYRHGLLDTLCDSLYKVTLFQCPDANELSGTGSSTPAQDEAVLPDKDAPGLVAGIIQNGYADGFRLLTDSNQRNVYKPTGTHRIYWVTVELKGTCEDHPYLNLREVKLKAESAETFPVFGVGKSGRGGRLSYRFGCSTSIGVKTDETYPSLEVCSTIKDDQTIIDVAYPVISYSSDETFVGTSGTIGLEGKLAGNFDIEVSDEYSRIKFLKTPSTFNLVFIVPVDASDLELVGLPG